MTPNHSLNRILAITSILSLLLTTFFIFRNWQLSSRLNQLTQAQTTPTPTPLLPPPDEMASWKTYTNTELGFEFKYPPTWTLDDSTQNQIDRRSNLYIYTNSDTVDSYLERNPDQIDQTNRKYITIGNTNAQRITIESNANTTEYILFPFQSTSLNQGSTIAIRAIYDDDGSIFDQILSTFKITSNETTNWKTYTSPRFNYSFSYPDYWFFLPWNESDPKNLYGAHTLHNYDFNEAEKHMTKGFVNWSTFMNKDALKIDISVAAEPAAIEQNLQELNKAEKLIGNEIIVGSQKLPLYRPKEFGPGPAADVLIVNLPLKPDLHIFFGIYGFYLQEKDLTKSKEWPTVNQILSTFRFTN